MNAREDGFPRFLAVALVLVALSLANAGLAGERAWTRLGPARSRQINALAIDPSAPATVYAGTAGGVFKSDDSGASWAEMNTGLASKNVSALAIDPRTPATLYAGTSSGVFKTTDGGDSWKTANEGVTADIIGALVIDPKTPATVYAVSGEFYYCEEDCLFKSINGGATWSPVHIFTNPILLSLTIDPVTPTTVYAGALEGAYKSLDGGGFLKMNLTAALVSALAIDPSHPATLYAATSTTFDDTEGGVQKSTDGGEHWNALNTGLPNKGVHALAIDPTNPRTLYAGTIGAGVFKSDDGGESWTEINAGLTYTSVLVLAVDPADPARVYAGTRGAVFAYEAAGPAPTCTADATTLCLNDGRFQVRTQWTKRDGSSGSGQAVELTGDTGYFTFFDAENVEVMVKVLDGCASNGKVWAFAGGLTNVGVVMTVTEVQTGAVKTYTNVQGTAFQPILDTNAFAACAGAQEATPAAAIPAAALPPIVTESFDATAAGCVADATTLCLNDSRYRVQAQWRAPDGRSGAGQVIALTEDTGAFWFFSANNVEVVVKVLNGCGVNSRHWAFAGGLTNVDVTLTVTDTQTGNVKTYTNAQGTPFPPVQDTKAFAACP